MTVDILSQHTIIWLLALLAIGFFSSLVGGVLSGIAIGGRQLGLQLSTQMGGLFGLLAGFPGITLALIIFVLIG
jgi:hypothetical protein